MSAIPLKNNLQDETLSTCRWSFWLAIAVFGLLALQSCNTTQFLDREKGEVLLVKNEIEFQKTERKKIKNKSNLSFELTNLYRQRPNRKFFGVPRPYFYYASLDTVDKSKIGLAFAKFQQNSLGEEPVFLDTSQVIATAEVMESYLQNRGYFLAGVNHRIKINKKHTKASVTYKVITKGRYIVDTISFESKDSVVQVILNNISKRTFFKKGNPVDIQLYEQEVSRITRYLRNNGYAYFYPQYLSNLEATDTSNSKLTAELVLEILLPPGKDKHPYYTVGNIYVDQDYIPGSENLSKPDTLFDGVFFYSGGRPFKVKPRTLTSSITFKTGEVFSQEEIDNTIRQLGALGVFRPPTIRFDQDSIHEGVLNFNILLTPNKKWEFGADLELSNTERRGVVSSNLIGLTFSPSLRNRNFLKGAELLVGNVDFGIELAPFNSDNSSIINSLDFRLQTDLYFPRFVDYFKLWNGLRKVGLTGDAFYNKLRKKANTRASAGYNLLVLLNNYQLQFANLSYGYDIPLNNKELVNINHFGIDLLIPQIVAGSRFDTLLTQQPFLQRSFSRQFITGLLFRDINYTYSNASTSSNSYWFLRGYFDLSGLELMGANELYNFISGKKTQFQVSGVDFSHYAKLELDGRHYWRFGPNRTLVARITSGITRPFYDSDAVPYVKQFYVGGPNSIRGWYARGLGPGLYRDTLADDLSSRNLFYQSADLKFEFNLEYRFFMMRPFGLFNLYGATFLDGGNIWTLEEDTSRPGSQLAFRRVTDDSDAIVQDNFVRTMALGTGFGTRWDFTYFILRLDLGVPLRNNYPDPERSNTYWTDLSKWQIKDIVLNLGLGYPF